MQRKSSLGQGEETEAKIRRESTKNYWNLSREISPPRGGLRNAGSEAPAAETQIDLIELTPSKSPAPLKWTRRMFRLDPRGEEGCSRNMRRVGREGKQNDYFMPPTAPVELEPGFLASVAAGAL
jgi:hypothetical protein